LLFGVAEFLIEQVDLLVQDLVAILQRGQQRLQSR